MRVMMESPSQVVKHTFTVIFKMAKRAKKRDRGPAPRRA